MLIIQDLHELTYSFIYFYHYYKQHPPITICYQDRMLKICGDMWNNNVYEHIP